MLNLAVYSVIVVRSTIKLSAVVDTNLRLILGLRVNGATECRSHDAGTPQLRTNFTQRLSVWPISSCLRFPSLHFWLRISIPAFLVDAVLF